MRGLAELPADCLLLIADQLSEERDLNSLTQTCSRLHILINPYLYRRSTQIRGKQTILWWATERGKVNTARYSIQAGADSNAPDTAKYGDKSSLFKALHRRSEARGCLNYRGLPEHTIAGELDKFRSLIVLLLDSGADLHSRSHQGWTPLHTAAWLPDEEMVQFLLERGADITLVSDEGSTPLHLAAFSGDVGVIRCLLQRGADIHARAMKGRTPLHWAAEESNSEAVAFLLANGANVDAIDEKQETPLHCAVKCRISDGIEGVIRALLDNGADIEALNAEGMTPLQIAVLRGQFKQSVRCLVDNGANVDVKCSDGRSLYNLAIEGHNYQMMDCFLRRSKRTAQRRL